MLSIIWQEKEIEKQQKILEGLIMGSFVVCNVVSEVRRKLNITGARNSRLIHTDGSFYFVTRIIREKNRIHRYWNVFGVYIEGAEMTPLDVAVEVNVPLIGDDRRVSGFFAADQDGRVWLMHSGRLGGTRHGGNKEEFLRATVAAGFPLVEVNGVRRHRRGIQIAPIDKEGLTEPLCRFIGYAEAFRRPGVLG